MGIRLQKYSYRFSEEIFNSNLALKNELEGIVMEAANLVIPTKKELGDRLDERFQAAGWTKEVPIVPQDDMALERLQYLKERVGVLREYGHPSSMGRDLFRFHLASNMDLIDFGVYITTTANFHEHMKRSDKQNKWASLLTFERVTEYLPHLKSAIQVPIYVIGIDL